VYAASQPQLFLSPGIKANREQKAHKLLNLVRLSPPAQPLPTQPSPKVTDKRIPTDYLILATAPLASPQSLYKFGGFPRTHKFSHSCKLSHFWPAHLSQNLLDFNTSMDTKPCGVFKLSEDNFKISFSENPSM